MTLDPLSLFAGLIAGILLAAAALGWKLAALREKLRQTENGADVAAGAHLVQLAEEKFKQAQAAGAHDLEKRQKAVSDLVDPIGKALKEMESKIEGLGKAGAGLEAQLKTFAQDQRLLRQETQNLVAALRNPAARGRWGELQLQRALEMIGMVEGTHFTQQQSVSATDGNTRRPDFVIHLPGGAQIVIDVKTPVEPYWQALESAESEAGRQKAFDDFRRHLRDHLKELKSREYWRHVEGSPEFVVMFLPTEGLYSMAVSNDPSLIEDAANANVILASPTTLMGLLRVVMHGWQQQKMAEEAKTVAALGADLYARISKFGEHMQKLGRNLSTALGAYNDAVGSLERMVLPGAKKMKELHVATGGKDLPDLPALEDSARLLTAPELLGEDEEKPKKRA